MAWTFRFDPEYMSAFVFDEDGEPICDVLNREHGQLFASSRDLLEALKGMLAENGALHVNSINSDSPAEKLARAAISRAEGKE